MGTGLFDLDIGDLVRQAQIAEQAVSARQKPEKPKKGSLGKHERKPSERQRGVDTPSTQNLVYRIMDLTDRKILLCRGLGMTETKVDELISGGHHLYLFMTTCNGDLLRDGAFYQFVLGNGKHPTYRYFWKPGVLYDSIEVCQPDQTMALFTVQGWPNIPGGLMFVLKEIEAEDDAKDKYEKVRLGERLEQEIAHLTAVKAAGKEVITRWLNPEEWVRALALATGTEFSEDAAREMIKFAKENALPWPSTPGILNDTKSVFRRKTVWVRGDGEGI